MISSGVLKKTLGITLPCNDGSMAYPDLFTFNKVAQLINLINILTQANAPDSMFTE